VASVSAASKAFVAAQAADRHARRTPCHRRVGETELRRSSTTEPVRAARSPSPGNEESPEKPVHHHHRRKGTKHHRSREDRLARKGMDEAEPAEPQRAPNRADAMLLEQMAARAAAERATVDPASDAAADDPNLKC